MQAIAVSILCFLAALGLTALVGIVRAPKLLDDKRRERPNEENLSQVEFSIFRKVALDFEQLTWAQKLALKRICLLPGSSEHDLVMHLQPLGFSDPPKRIIEPLMLSPLVQVGTDKDGNKCIEPSAAKLKLILRVINASPLC